MALTLVPDGSWHYITTTLLACMALLLVASGWHNRWATLAVARPHRAMILGLSLLAGLALGLAAWNPQLVKRQQQTAPHLVVLLDVSESIPRSELPPTNKRLIDIIKEAVGDLPSSRRSGATFDLLSFGATTTQIIREAPLRTLVTRLNGLQASDFAPGHETDMASALRAASQRFETIGRAGSVLLISDGNQTQDDAAGAVSRLANQGIAIHVLPLDSGMPLQGIVAADLPRQVESLTETRLRGVFANHGDGTVGASLAIRRNPGLLESDDHFGSSAETQTQFELQGAQRISQPLQFQGFGIQFLDLVLKMDEGGEHRRRFYTQVIRPPKILAIGGDQRWTSLIDPDLFEVTQAVAKDLGSRYRAVDFDAVVISAIFAKDFSTNQLTDLAKAVTDKGIGLFLINGNHQGLSQESPTVLASYRDTPLEAVLAVKPGPRPFRPDPPPRQIVILIDTSGSMGGWRLNKAKAIASHIVANQLRPKDTLDLLTFTTNVGYPVKRRRMDPAGKDFALKQIAGLKSGGGTDPRQALSLIASRRMTDCGLIFISDGEFNDITYRPDCRATVFAVGKAYIPPGSPLNRLADPFPVTSEFNPAEITIPYFHPKPRKRFFEKDTFVPLKIERFLGPEFEIPMPSLPMNGEAVSYPREETNLVGVRPKLTDPVLAFYQAEAGHSGVFTGALEGNWLQDETARAAIHRWLKELVRFTARDRYDFEVTDCGKDLELVINLVPKDRRLPAVSSLNLRVETEVGEQIPILLRADPVTPGAFVGRIDVPRTDHAQRLQLHLREVGSEALLRTQVIPMLYPAKGHLSPVQTAESTSWGTNREVLAEIAQLGDGAFETFQTHSILPRLIAPQRGFSLVPYCLLACLACLLAAFMLRRLVR